MPATGTEEPEARAYKKVLVKQRSYFLRCGAVTEMSLILSSTGSAIASSAAMLAVCDVAGTDSPAVYLLDGVFAISTRLLLIAGPSCASVTDNRSYTKLAISLNNVVRVGVSS